MNAIPSVLLSDDPEGGLLRGAASGCGGELVAGGAEIATADPAVEVEAVRSRAAVLGDSSRHVEQSGAAAAAAVAPGRPDAAASDLATGGLALDRERGPCR